jgi:hypothetical protein
LMEVSGGFTKGLGATVRSRLLGSVRRTGAFPVFAAA